MKLLRVLFIVTLLSATAAGTIVFMDMEQRSKKERLKKKVSRSHHVKTGKKSSLIDQ